MAYAAIDDPEPIVRSHLASSRLRKGKQRAKTPLTPRPFSWIDHVICPEQQRLRDRQPEGLRGLEIDHQLEGRRLLDGEIGGLGTSKQSIDVVRGARSDVTVAVAELTRPGSPRPPRARRPARRCPSVAHQRSPERFATPAPPPDARRAGSPSPAPSPTEAGSAAGRRMEAGGQRAGLWGTVIASRTLSRLGLPPPDSRGTSPRT